MPRRGNALREVNLASRHTATVRVGGRNFALVLVDDLEPDTSYQYTLEFAPPPAGGRIPQTEPEFSNAVFPASLPAQVLAAQAGQVAASSLRGDKWLLLRTLRKTYERLRFAHGSCRKWPGDSDLDGKTPGPDMLGIFAAEWLATQKVISEWPRFFLHTGDQIYADDIGLKQGEQIMRQRFGSIIPGPRGGDIAEGAWAGRFAARYSPISPQITSVNAAPTRTIHARMKVLEAELAASPANQPPTADLVAKGRKYLELRKALDQEPGFQRAWKFVDAKRPMRFKNRIENAVLWNVPYEKSDVPDVTLLGLRRRDKERSYYASAGETDAVHAADFAEYSYLYQCAWTTENARKTLAHIPSFMIFDDHEVTDDWNFNRKWVEIVHDEGDIYRMWPSTITDALAAYWMYQGWGNPLPRRLEDRSAGADSCAGTRRRTGCVAGPSNAHPRPGNETGAVRKRVPAPADLVLHASHQVAAVHRARRANRTRGNRIGRAFSQAAGVAAKTPRQRAQLGRVRRHVYAVSAATSDLVGADA